MRALDKASGEVYEVWFVEKLYDALTGQLPSSKEGTAIPIDEKTRYGDFLGLIDFEVKLAIGELVEVEMIWGSYSLLG